MKVVRKESTKVFNNSSACTATEYPLNDSDINLAIITLNGRYPDIGRTVNLECKELAYILEGQGRLCIEGADIALTKGDALVIEKGERFYWEGTMTIFMPCTPAWNPEQHKEVE